jgi:hypothetical protein
MAGKQKSGGGAKKYGRDKADCERYRREGHRQKAKLKNYRQHNLPKEATEEIRNAMLAKWKDSYA